jgi:hypothetical protein
MSLPFRAALLTALFPALLLAPAAALAADDGRVATVHVTGLTGYPDVLGGSVSLTKWRPLELEAGLSLYSPRADSGGSYYARAGYAKRMDEVRLIEVQLLGGYRHQRGIQLQYADDCRVCDRELATVNLGLERLWGSTGGPYFSGQAMIGVGIAYNDVGTKSGAAYPEMRLALGVGF